MAIKATFKMATLGALALMLSAGSAAAQTYPTKPIRLVVPTAASTPIDIICRVVAQKLGSVLAQPLVVENKGGGSGIIGVQDVLRQQADGYTLMTLFMPLTVVQNIYPNVQFDLRKDFVAVGQTAWSYNVLVVPASFKASSAGELVSLLKANPGKFTFASGGPGSPAHIAGELLKQQTGTQAVHVPYNQFSQAIGDLLSGRHQFMFVATPPAMSHIAAGKLRALAVTGPKRIAALKDVPTMVEAGFPDFVVRDWQGFAVKAGTPKGVISKLHGAITQALAAEEVKQAMAKLGADPAPGTPEDFGKLVADEIERWGRVAKAGNIRVE